MSGWLLLVALGAGDAPAAVVAGAPQAAPAPPCADWAECEAMLRELARRTDGYALDAESREFAYALHLLGPAAWDGLLALANDPARAVRQLAGYAIGAWPDPPESALPALIDVLAQSPGSWPAHALARIGGAVAVEALLDDHLRTRQGTQSSLALATLMPEALPEMLAALEVRSERALHAVAYALRMLAWQGGEAAERHAESVRWLLEFAVSPGVAAAQQTLALRLLLELAPLAHGDPARLQVNLMALDERVRDLSEELLSLHGDPVALDAVLARCERVLGGLPPSGDAVAPAVYLYEQCTDRLARMGEAARSAAPRLLRALPEADQDSRNVLIATLGHLGDAAVVPALIPALRSHDDREVTAALEALWRLAATESLPMIRDVASRHWLAPVRDFAGHVAAAMEGGDAAAVEAMLADPWRGDSPSGRHLFGLPSMQAGYGERACRVWRVDGVEITHGESVVVPDHALAAEVEDLSGIVPLGGGHLVGSNAGVWGGALDYRDEGGRLVRISDDNVVALLPHTPAQALALVGHFLPTDPGGWLLVLTATPGAVPRIVDRRRLPSAPRMVQSLGGSWLVTLHAGAGVLIDRELGLREAECAQRFGEKSRAGRPPGAGRMSGRQSRRSRRRSGRKLVLSRIR
jgi:HEAT repeat protein